jgi:hypothetical protein
MNDYVTENERILKEWQDSYVKENQSRYPDCTNLDQYFTPDGIMFKGSFLPEQRTYPDGKKIFRWKREKSGEENSLWAKAPLRVLFLTKDQNTDGDIAWDVRSESFRYRSEEYKPEEMWLDTRSTFFRNLVYSLYGIMNTTANRPINYNDFNDKEALAFVDKQIFARINCKKEVGDAKCENPVLAAAIDRDKNFLKQQILNLDADILVCCGSQNDKNLILNTVYDIYENEFKYMNFIDGKGTGMHYNKKRNKLAIDAYHLSFFKKGGLEARYNENVGMYYEFLKHLKDTEGIDFSAAHR